MSDSLPQEDQTAHDATSLLIRHSPVPPRVSNEDERSGGLGDLTKNRVEALSDGVFAIVLTLLFLELRVPEVANPESVEELSSSLIALWPKAASCIASFVLLGIVWTGHHLQFEYIRRTDRLHIWINLAILLGISFLPFTTAVLGQYLGNQAASELYGLNVLFVAFAALFNWWYSAHHRRLLDPGLDQHVVRAIERRLLVLPVALTLAIGLSPVSPWLSICIYVLLPVAYFSMQTRDALRAQRRRRRARIATRSRTTG
jgi:uncharacterized membrane protein